MLEWRKRSATPIRFSLCYHRDRGGFRSHIDHGAHAVADLLPVRARVLQKILAPVLLQRGEQLGSAIRATRGQSLNLFGDGAAKAVWLRHGCFPE
jgi:hypothetical protein